MENYKMLLNFDSTFSYEVHSYIITMFFLYCIAKMTDFLFDLDKKTDNNV